MAAPKNNQNHLSNQRAPLEEGDTGVPGPVYAPGVPKREGKDLLDPEQIARAIEKLKELESLKDQIKDLKESRIRYIEILGLFVALFTFVSIEFQLAKNFDFSQFLFFSPLFAGLLTLFVFVLHVTIHEKINLRTTILILLLILVFFAGGFLSRFFLSEIKNTSTLPQSRDLDIEKINVEHVRIDPQR